MLQAKDIMHPRLSVMDKEKGDALIRKMLCEYPALPVINEKLEVLGVVSEHDILFALKEGRTIHEFDAETVMTSPAYTAYPDTPVTAIIEKMVTNQLTLVPVVAKGNSQLVGIISRKNILNAASEHGFWPEHEFKKRV
jgi:CBS domain-containing protein